MIIEIIKKFCENESIENFVIERLERLHHSAKLKNKKIPSNLGLVLLKSIAKQLSYGANPLEILDFDEIVESSFECCKQKDFLKSLAKRFLIGNKHCLFARMNPVISYNEKQIEEEKKNLEKIKKSLSQDQVQKILDNMGQISEEKNKKQPLFLLPQIRRSDRSAVSLISRKLMMS